MRVGVRVRARARSGLRVRVRVRVSVGVSVPSPALSPPTLTLIRADATQLCISPHKVRLGVRVTPYPYTPIPNLSPRR